MTAQDLSPVGYWRAGSTPAAFQGPDLVAAVARVRETAHVVREGAAGRIGVGFGGGLSSGGDGSLPLMATLPALYPEWLGDRSFCEVHGVRFPYVAGEMANGIATTRMVIAMARAEMLGFFGAAGLGYPRVEKSLDEIIETLGDGASWGINLIHSPQEPALEEKVADLLIRRNVTRVSASAFMALTPAIVRYAASGLTQDASGRVRRRFHVFAKISRPEVARKFMSPPPEEMLRGLVDRGLLTASEAALARRVPVAEDITVEADSGGHTDNQALTALFPTITRLRDEVVAEFGFDRPIRIGAAGGIGTPGAAAAAFSLGAAYILTGSVNQAAQESGLSQAGREMLAKAELADVIMAPAADMFELGVKVQVLKRGTMFGVRGLKLYDIYHQYAGLSAIPADVRARLEKDVLHATFDEVWEDTRRFWTQRDPAEAAKAERDPKHQMALCFRWYLGKASKWAIDGEASRRMDYQVWCGPAMGSFNSWVKGSYLEPLENRAVVPIALNILEGAAVITRAQQLRSYGVAVPDAAFQYRPRPLA